MDEHLIASEDWQDRHARHRRRSILLLTLVVVAITGVEAGRQLGFDVPVPFMIIYGTMAVAAASCGLRIGLVAAGLGTLYTIFSHTVGFGPDAMTGSTLRVLAAAGLTFLIGGILGYEHDVRDRLVRILRRRDQELSAARKRLEERVLQTSAHLDLTRSELGHARYQMEQAMTHAPIGVVAIDTERELTFVNDAALHLFGCEALPETVNNWNTLVRAVHIFDAQGARILPPDGPVSKALSFGEIFKDFECRIVGFDGKSRWCNGFIGPVFDTERRIIGASIMFLETTEQRDAAQALQRLTQMLFKVQEEERGSLAHELHEKLGQSLTAIKLSLHAAAGDERTNPALASTMSQIDQMADVIRKLSRDLRPTALDDFGLRTAIDAYLKQVKKPESMECKLKVSGDLDNISDETAIVAYRIIQEAVGNSIQHAEAASVEVRLSTNENMLRVEIIDDGSGFDKSAIDELTLRSRHMGLLFMRERARQSGGQLSISTSADNGTWISVDLPFRIGAINAKDQAGPD
jgi:signal transduction histidine kinase